MTKESTIRYRAARCAAIAGALAVALALPAMMAILLGCAGRAPRSASPPPAPAARSSALRVIVVSVDGLMPATYLEPDAHGLQVPVLRALYAGGAYSKGVQSVYPSVTYPAHTTMVTGVLPASHGIFNNKAWDPLLRNLDGWNWYTEDIKVPTIWQAAEDAGLVTGLVTWPVTVGVQVDWLVPEYVRAGTPDDIKLIKTMSTPGLLKAVAARNPDFWEHFTPPNILDKAQIDIAIHLLKQVPSPDLMLVHMWMVDEFQHRNGPWSPEARARIEEADTQLGRLIATIGDAGLWDDTILMVVSDHGFVAIDNKIRPGVVLAELGLVTLDEDQKLTDWRATAHLNSGQAYIYVKDEADTAAKDALTRTFSAMAGTPGSGIGHVRTRDEIRARGGDDTAFLSLEGAPGFSFSAGYTGAVLLDRPGKGNHGYDPELPDMQASLLVYGPRVVPGEIAAARLIDVAPTIARLLELRFPGAAGTPLPIVTRSPDPGWKPGL